MSAPRFGPAVTNAIADLRSRRAAYGADLVNEAEQINQARHVARQAEIHGARTVAEVASRFPAAFADHHYNEGNDQ